MRYLLVLSSIFLISCSLIQRQAREDNVKRVPSPYGISDSGMKKRVLVLPFQDKDPSRSENVKEDARKFLVAQLNRTGKVYVVRSEDLPQDIQSYFKDGKYDIPAIANMARGLDISMIIEGHILDLQAQKLADQVGLVRDVNAKMTAKTHLKAYSAKNASVIVDQNRTATAEANVRVYGKEDVSARALQEKPALIRASLNKALSLSLVPIIRSIDKISWSGRVALVKGDRIYVNAGKISGIQLGDILRVSGKGEDIFDPETGKLIGVAPGRTKGTIEVIHYFGKDGSVAIIHSGGGFKENDKVELYY
tara:strand:+ start:3682 stop:4602 length:921 start_codon:yes stop_codon:yes gene_type:complete